MNDHSRKRWRKRLGRSTAQRPAHFDEDDFDAIGGGYPDQPEGQSNGRKRR